MSQKSAQEHCRIGFLTVVETRDRGYVGGLLVTNQLGRPLEFQCTTPVKPNRTQEILYGPTLRSFIYGELIAATLLERAGIRPDVILVEQSDAMTEQSKERVPRGIVLGDHDDRNSSAISLGGSRIQFQPGMPPEELQRLQSAMPEQADLSEPFERIREALKETLKTAAA